MTFYSKVGSFNTSSGAASNTITNLGFTPVALIMWVGGQSTTGWGTAGTFATGFSANNNGTMQYGTSGINDVSGASPSYASYSAASALQAKVSGPIAVLSASGVAFSSGQFVVSWTTHTGAYTVYYLALGGTDIAGAGVVSWTTPTAAAPASKSVTGLGFQPTCVMHVSAPYTSPYPSYWLGAMDSTGNQWAEVVYGDNTGGLHTGRAQITDHCLVNASGTPSAAINRSATYTSMDSGGFTVSFDLQTNATSQTVYSLCLAGCGVQVGHKAKTGQTAAVTDTVSGLGFTPSAVVATTDSYAASASAQLGLRIDLGASDGTHFGTVAMTDETAVSAVVCHNYNHTASAIILSNNDAATTECLATIGNFATGAFDIVWSADTKTDATVVNFIAFGASGNSSAWTETSAEDISCDTIAPTLAASSTITLPAPQDIAADIVAITKAAAITAPTPHNVAAAALVPTLTAYSTVTLPAPQNVAADIVAVTKDLGAAPSVPDVAAAIVAATPALGVLPSPQDVAVAALAPTSVVPVSRGSAWWRQVTVPGGSSKSIGAGNDTTVINAAPTGPTYDGAASENLYVTEPSTATAFDFSSPTGTGTEYVRIPSAVGIDDLQQLTLEFIVYYRDGNTGNWPFLWDKSPLPNRWYIRAVDDPTGAWSYRLEYHLDCTGSGSFGNGYQYFTPSFSFVPGTFYYIQLTHDRSDVGNKPVIKINDVTQDLTQNIDGAPDALYSDSGFDMYLANCAEIQTCGLGVDVLLFRMYNTILTDDELIANFNASSWRFEESSWIQVTVPGTTSGVNAPSFGGTNVIWTQDAVPDTTSDVFETFEYMGLTWPQDTTPDTTSAATVPSMIIGWVQLVVPDTTSETFKPGVIGTTVIWVQTIVPTTSSSSISLTTQGWSIVERVRATLPLEEYRVGGYGVTSAPRVETKPTDDTERIIIESPAQEFRIESEIPVIRITCELEEQ